MPVPVLTVLLAHTKRLRPGQLVRIARWASFLAQVLWRVFLVEREVRAVHRVPLLALYAALADSRWVGSVSVKTALSAHFH
jgi:hypothetical protein